MPFKLVKRVPEGASPEDYGFKVYKAPGASDEDVAEFYLAAKERSGVQIPKFEALVDELVAAGRLAVDDEAAAIHED